MKNDDEDQQTAGRHLPPPTSFRIPEQLIDDFRVACIRRKLKKQDVVAHLIERWLANSDESALPISGSSPLTISPYSNNPDQNCTFDSGKPVVLIQGNIAPQEKEWIERALKVLRSSKQQLITALQFNLLEFAEVAERYEREHSADSHQAGTDQRSTVQDIGAKVAEADRDRVRSQTAIEKLQETPKGSGKRAHGQQRKARSGR